MVWVGATSQIVLIFVTSVFLADVINTSVLPILKVQLYLSHLFLRYCDQYIGSSYNQIIPYKRI